MRNPEDFLLDIDELLFSFLQNNVQTMPMRLVKLIANNYTDARIRKLYWRRLGVVMGENSYSNIGMRIASNDFKDRIFIGKNVSIAPNVIFVTESTANNGKEINEIPYVLKELTKSGDIIVEDEVWIGASVTILPGVHIGRCSVIGAGSLVLTNVESYSIYAGVPAKKIRDLNTELRI